MATYINLDDFMQDAEPALTWDILVYLNKAEKIDIVPCKECKHYAGEQTCSKWFGMVIIPKNGNGFCSYGKRKGKG